MKVYQDSPNSAELNFSTPRAHQSPTNQQNEPPENLSPRNSGRKITQITHKDIGVVQNLIERCLQLYMDRGEAVACLSIQAGIDSNFTNLVWQKLEEENAEFFRAYNTRLVLKNQINRFNDLLDRQICLMTSHATPKSSSVSMHSGILHMPGNNLGCSIQHPSALHPQIHMVNEIPASNHFLQKKINTGKEMERNGIPTESAHATKSEMSLRPTVAPYDQYPLVSELEMHPLPPNLAYTLRSSEAIDLGSNYEIYSSTELSHQPLNQTPLNYSDIATEGSDVLLETSEHIDNVESYFADIVPAQDT